MSISFGKSVAAVDEDVFGRASTSQGHGRSQGTRASEEWTKGDMQGRKGRPQTNKAVEAAKCGCLYTCGFP